MAIGDTVQAGLMRIDTSAYERAGQANANANQAFGNALNQVAKGFIEGQEKRARAEEMTGFLMNQGVSEKDAKAIAKNPFLQKEYQRKKGAEHQLKMEGNRLKMEAQKLAAQQRSSASQAFQKNREMDMKEELFRTQQDEIREDKQAISEANRLMRTRPQTETPEFSNLLEQFNPDQIPGTPEFEAKELSEPMGARPPLMASFATDKPNFEMFNVGKAPIEQQLPESFQGQAGRIIDMADNGEISPQAADLALNRIQGQAMAEQKAAYSPTELKALRELEKPLLNPGEIEIDKLVGKEYSEFVNMGGQAAVNSKIQKLDDAIVELEKDGDLTGWIKGSLPESLKALFNSKGLSTKEAVESVIQENLRETLGAQFAQKEGEMFMARGYNDKLGDTENAKRVRALLKEIKDRAKARNQSFEYFKDNGTMKGYEGPSFKTVESQSPETGGIKTSTQGKYRVGDLSVGNYQPGQ